MSVSFGMLRRLTLSPENEFTFECPIFGAETKMATCMKLRERVWRGERPAQRQGCQACMMSSKCPVIHIVNDLNKRDDDPYASKKPYKGKLEQHILDKISPIVVRDEHIKLFSISDGELSRIRRANANAAPVDDPATPPTPGSKPKRRKQSASKQTQEQTSVKQQSDDMLDAAKTGDMSAVINSANENPE